MALDANRIRKTVRKLRKLMKKAPKRATVEQVHRLRTDIRRLEAAFDTLSPNPRRSEHRLLRDLGRIRKRAGKIRDMDVLTAATSSVRGVEEQDCAVQLLQYLGAQRYKHARRLHAVMRKDGQDIRRRAKRISDRLVKQIPEPGRDSANDQPGASAEAITAATRLSIELRMPPTLNRTNLHPYRLKVKELRDVLRLAEDPVNQEFIDTLGEVKDAIGEWHDWEELVTIAAKVLDHGAQCKLTTKLKDISRQKYDHALSITINMRKQFLRSRDHKRLDPTLVATAAVAR